MDTSGTLILAHCVKYKKNYLYIYEDNFGAKVLRDDCTLIVGFLAKKAGIAMYKNP